MSRTRRALAIVGLLVFGCAAMGASCDEDPPDVSITFVNQTDRQLTYLVSFGGESYATVADRTIKLPATVAPGEQINTAAPAPVPSPAEGEPWCPGSISYYFISPKDPTLISPGAPTSAQPDFDIDAVDVLDVLEEPCWPGKTGNRYTVGG